MESFGAGFLALSSNIQSLCSKKPDKVVQSVPRVRNGLSAIARSFMWEDVEEFTPPPKAGQKTLILDMDETMIHSADFPPHKSVEYFMIGDPEFYVFKRPGLDEFIRKVTQQFEVFVFTFGDRNYAEPVLNIVCPMIDDRHRLYRDSCENSNGRVKKDLSLFNRPKKDVILVDDSSSAFNYNKKSTVRIDRWVGSPTDTALIDWLPQLLDKCVEADDVRTLIADDRNKRKKLRHRAVM